MITSMFIALKVCRDRTGYVSVPVTISGEPADCENAKKLIESLLDVSVDSSNCNKGELYEQNCS